MSFNSKKFESLLPAFFLEVLKELSSFGLIPTLVGGATRDFVLHGNLGHDWDIELSHPTVSWSLDQWKALGKTLAKHGRTTYLTYDVIRLEIQGHQLEFSPPRIEKFHEHLKDHGHRNFAVEFDYKMPFEKAVLRRDFTMNAMGIRFIDHKHFEFLDPLEGMRHLHEKVLHPAGPDFKKDPVRFLRALRFSMVFHLGLSETLKDHLQTMDVKDFSANYLWMEMQKSKGPLEYYHELLKWLSFHPEMTLPIGLELNNKYEQLQKVLQDSSQHETWMIALEWVGLSAEKWQQYFSQSSETARRLGRWAQVSNTFQDILPETFHGDFEVVRNHPEFEKLFDWYFTTKQLLQKNPSLPLLQMIGEYLPSWIHLYKFEPVKDVKHIDPPFRAKYQVWNLCQRL